MEGSVRSSINIEPPDDNGGEYFGGLTVSQFNKRPVDADYPGDARDPDGFVREWEPVVALTLNPTRISHYGLKREILKNELKLKELLSGMSAVLTRSVAQGLIQMSYSI